MPWGHLGLCRDQLVAILRHLGGYLGTENQRQTNMLIEEVKVVRDMPQFQEDMLSRGGLGQCYGHPGAI